MNQNNIDAEGEILKILSEELSKNIDNAIMMDIIYPETIGWKKVRERLQLMELKREELEKKS